MLEENIVPHHRIHISKYQKEQVLPFDVCCQGIVNLQHAVINIVEYCFVADRKAKIIIISNKMNKNLNFTKFLHFLRLYEIEKMGRIQDT